MLFYEKLEKWKDGTIRYFERDNKGHFKTSIDKKFYSGQNVGIWNKEPQQKITPEINHSDYVDKSKGEFYRASISLNIPYHGMLSHPNYVNFTYVVVDKKENINMEEMYEEFIQQIEDKSQLGYSRDEFIWFDFDYKDCDKQLPKPYSATKPSKHFEGI